MSPSQAPSPPTHDAILAYHDRMVAALKALGRSFEEEVKRPKGPFHGLRRKDFDLQLEWLRDELDQQVVLALAASVEALVRADDALRRKEPGTDPVRQRLRFLAQQHGERVSLEDILDVWKDAVGAGDEVGRLKQLYHRRHWLAHGRYWSDKSGVQPDPRSAFRSIIAFMARVRTIAPDFPRS